MSRPLCAALASLSLLSLGCRQSEMQPAPPALPPEVQTQLTEGVVVKKADQPQGERFVVLAGKRLEAPPGFKLQLTQNPPLEKLTASSIGAKCEMGVLLGHDKPEDRQKLVAAMQSSYPGDKSPYTHHAAGLQLVGVEIKASQTRLFSTQLGSDLLAVSYVGANANACDPLLDQLVATLKK